MRIDEITKNEFKNQLRFTPDEQEERQIIAEILVYGTMQPTLKKAFEWLNTQRNGWESLCNMLNDPRQFDNEGTVITKEMFIDRVKELAVHDIYENVWEQFASKT